MKSIHKILLLLTLFTCVFANAQNTPVSTSFKVDGACGMCKQRIQKALNIKGIRLAKWDVSSKMLAITYEPAVISLDKIHDVITSVGHDTEAKKADDAAYKSLPDCCLYRDVASHDDSDDDVQEIDTLHYVHGLVTENKSGQQHPLAGASIFWVGTRNGTKTNVHGEFVLPKHSSTNQLVISYSGFKTDTVSTNGMNDIEITLGKKDDLSAITITVTARRRTSYIDARNPFRINVITKKELLKAACCNLSESFETNPSVDVSYNDAVTGSKQIQLLGLAGIYTQLTVENLPGPRGIATPLGLNMIAGPWVESIQLIKGAGSVVNGYESIAGQINVELQKPREADKLYANGYVNSMGKTDVNLNLAHRFNGKWSTGFLLHDDFLYNKVDFNKDGFRDLPTGNQFSGINRWQYLGDKGLISHFGVKVMTDSKTGGQVDFDPSSDRLTTKSYGIGIDSRRYEIFGKIGYVFPDKMYKSVGFEAAAFDHEQDAYFGLSVYNARQRNFYSNLIYQSQIKSDAHQIKTGLSFLHDGYNEEYNGAFFNRKEIVPGAFAEYTFKHKNKLDVVAGMRIDHNNLYGWFATPRLNMRFEPVNGTVIRMSAGRGQRTANIFAEHMGNLISSRHVTIENNGNNSKAYGLNPEVAWNKGVSVDQKFKLFSRDASLGVDFYRNDFVNQVVADLEDVHQLKFYDLRGKSYSNSLQAELNVTPFNKLDVRMAYRYFDVKTTFDGELLQKPFTARDRAFANLAYDLRGWKFDYTVNFVGSKRIPLTMADPSGHKMPEKSPTYVTMNAQISKSFGKDKQWDVYAGGENLTNYMQHNLIISADDPFGDHFDASMVWGPASGRMFYTGFRYKLQ